MRVFTRCKDLINNAGVVIYSRLIRRDYRVVLIGAWMGEKFADNSRFLFQYLSSHKEENNLKHVVWATRSPDVKNELIKMGYSCVLIGTKESFYWHCKSGIHVICNMTDGGDNYNSDIDITLSAGAKKVQLWHGNGIKCVPGSIRENNRLKAFLHKISSKGCWDVDNYYYLCKNDIDVKFFEQKFGARPERCIDGAYPRTCPCERYTEEELRVIERLKQYNKVIIYLPTFRAKYDEFIHPLAEHSILEYLEINNILWIEKPHSADKTSSSVSTVESNNVLHLDSSFDINVLMPLIDVLVTDYSSAMLDALYFEKQVVYYVPDYEYYIKDDRGFLIDYDSVCINKKVESIDGLLSAIEIALNTNNYGEEALRIRRMFWKYDNWGYKEIWEAILKKIYE